MKSHLTRDAVAGAVRFRPGAARTARVSMRVRIRRSPIPVGTMSKHSFLAICRWAAALAVAFAALPAHASFLSGEALDKAADIIAIVVLIVVPVVVIVVFWLRPCPAREDRGEAPSSADCGDPDAVPAFARVRRTAVAARVAVGVHQAGRLQAGLRHRQARDYFARDDGEKARAGELPHDEVAHLRGELDAMAAKGALPPDAEDASRRPRAAAARRGAAPTAAEEAER